jgi:alkylated DNA repair dioxygenase AlkB
MTVSVQETLLDMGDDGPALGTLESLVRRTPLTRGAWVDFCPGWLTGSAEVFGGLVETVPWRAEQRKMYDRVVAVPRLLCFYGEDAPLPDPVLTAAREALNAHYGPELGEPFRTAGLCLYRDGRDSVAWHGDTIGRGQVEDTMVAIVSLGSPRALTLRPRGGGSGASGPGARPLRFEVGHGDLLVMGGSCQRTWEHAVPKTTRAIGPRISVQFRPRDVR